MQTALVNATTLDAAVPEEVTVGADANADGDVSMEQMDAQDISISEEYDADVSQTQSQMVVQVVPKRSARASRPSRKAAAALSPIASEADLGTQTINEPAPPAAVSDVASAETSIASAGAPGQPAPEDSEDVFGPTSRRIAKAKKGRGKGKKRASSSRPSGDSESESCEFTKQGIGTDRQVCRCQRGRRLSHRRSKLIRLTRFRFRRSSRPLHRA